MLDAIPKWAVRNRAIVDVLVVVWLVGGIYAFLEIRREFFPQIEVDAIRIVTVLPGATPEDVEQLVTAPIEDAVIDIAGIDELISQSVEGRSEVSVKVDVDAAGVDEVLREIESAVDRITDLPADAENPQVIKAKFEAPVVVTALLGEAPWTSRKKIVDRLEDRYRELPGVASIVVAGLNDREIVVEIDPVRISSLGVTADEIARAIRAADVDLAAGLLQTRDGDVLVRISDDLATVEEIGRVVVKKVPGGVVTVADLAELRSSLAKERTRSRINGRPATVITVTKTRDGDILRLSESIHAILAEERTNLPEGLSLEWAQDNSRYVRERLDVAYMSGTFGFVIVFLLLAIFLDLPSAIWCAYGIPVSILGGILILHLTGGTINMLTLFGFILVIGMLVDDAIVVVENVKRHRDLGLDPLQAVVKGTVEVARPITAAVATTIAALLPMALMTGVMGRFMGEIPKPGMYALAASLLEALLTLPVHLYATARWGRPAPLRGFMSWWDGVRARADRFLGRARRIHRRCLVKILRRRYLFLAGIGGLLGLTVVAAVFFLRYEFVSTRDSPLFVVEIEAPAGTSLDEMSELSARVERLVYGLPAGEVESVSTTLGLRRTNWGFEYGRELAQIMVELASPEIRERDASEIMDGLRPRFAEIRGARISVSTGGGGPPVGKPINARISGANLEDLIGMAERIKTHIAGLEGAVEIQDDLKAGKRQIVVRPNKDALAMAGIDPSALARELRAAVDGLEATSIRLEDEDVEIVVRYAPRFQEREADIERIWIATPSGAVPIANLAEIRAERGWSTIRHFDGDRTISITAEIEERGVEAGEAVESIREAFARDAAARGIRLEFGGQDRDTRESMRSLGVAAVAAIILIGIILVLEFGNFLQPLAVLAALPLALVGVVLTLIIHTAIHETTGLLFPTPLGLMPLIGLTALLGVIVNDAIVLIDFINNTRRTGSMRWRSIVRAAGIRLRAVFLTSATTAAGVLPMAYTLRGSSAFLAPMALTFGWGLVFGTLLVLFVVPVVVAVLDDLNIRVRGRMIMDLVDEA